MSLNLDRLRPRPRRAQVRPAFSGLTTLAGLVWVAATMPWLGAPGPMLAAVLVAIGINGLAARRFLREALPPGAPGPGPAERAAALRDEASYHRVTTLTVAGFLLVSIGAVEPEVLPRFGALRAGVLVCIVLAFLTRFELERRALLHAARRAEAERGD